MKYIAAIDQTGNAAIWGDDGTIEDIQESLGVGHMVVIDEDLDKLKVTLCQLGLAIWCAKSTSEEFANKKAMKEGD